MTNAYHTLLCMYQCRKVYANIVHAIEVDKRFYDLKRYSTRTDVEMAVKGYQPNAVFWKLSLRSDEKYFNKQRKRTDTSAGIVEIHVGRAYTGKSNTGLFLPIQSIVCMHACWVDTCSKFYQNLLHVYMFAMSWKCHS